MPGKRRADDAPEPADDADAAGAAGGFDRIVDELYASPPEDFVAVRDERARQAREAGDRDLARSLRELRRPTRPAWLVNLLWQERQDTMAELLDLGAAMRRAQEKADGAALRELSDTRRRLVDGLIGQARTLASDAGLTSVPADVERAVQQTLEAALADRDVADQVRTGRLVKPAEYTGFGVGSAAEVAVVSRPASRSTSASTPAGRTAANPAVKPADKPAQPADKPAVTPADKPTRPRDDAERARRAEATAQREREAREQRAREAAERTVEEARERLDAAERDLDANEHALQDAIRHRDDLTVEVQELRERVRELERRLRTGESDVRVATTRRNRSDTAYTRAEERLREAQEALDSLS